MVLNKNYLFNLFIQNLLVLNLMYSKEFISCFHQSIFNLYYLVYLQNCFYLNLYYFLLYFEVCYWQIYHFYFWNLNYHYKYYYKLYYSLYIINYFNNYQSYHYRNMNPIPQTNLESYYLIFNHNINFLYPFHLNQKNLYFMKNYVYHFIFSICTIIYHYFKSFNLIN